MPTYIVCITVLSLSPLRNTILMFEQVTCKDNASAEEVAAAKQHAKDQGGKITHEYNLIKGFA